MKGRALLLLILRAGLGAVFVVSGFQKLSAPAENFKVVIEQFEFVSGPLAVWLSLTLPWAELVAGALFILGLYTRLSLAALWLMNTAFIALLSSALLRKLPVEKCGCFGEAITLSVPQMLALDAALWALFLLFFLTHERVGPPSLDASLR